jgi:hypothetical protein
MAMPFGAGEEYAGKKRESDFIFYDIIKPAVESAFARFDLEAYLLSNHPDIKTSFHKFELNPITNKSALPDWKNIHSGEVWKKSLADENKNFSSLQQN